MRIIKRIILTLTLIPILLIGSSATYIYFKQDDLEQMVIEKVNQELKSPVHINNLEFSAVKNFPYISIDFEKIIIIDAFQKDTLCNIDELSVKFNALDLYNQIYDIQELSLKNGFITIYYQDNLANYEIWYSSTDSSSTDAINFGLQNVNLKNLLINYKDKNIESSTLCRDTKLKLSLKDGQTFLNISGQLINHKLIIDHINHFAEKPITLNPLSIQLDSISSLVNTQIVLDEIPLTVDVKNLKNLFSLSLSTSNLDLKTAQNLLPKSYLESIKDFDISGQSNIQLKLLSDQKETPKIDLNFSLDNATIKGKDLPFAIQQLSLKGQYSNGSDRNNSSSQILLDNIQLIANNEAIVAKAKIKDLDDPFIDLQLTTQLQLHELEKWGYKAQVDMLNGQLDINLSYLGKIGLKNKATYDVAMAEKSAQIHLQNLNLKVHKNSPMLSNSKANILISNDRIEIDSFNGQLAQESKFNFNGVLENVFSYLFLKNAPLKIGGSISSDWLIVDELITANDSSTNKENSTNKEALILPDDIIANLKLHLTDLTYERFHMRNFTSDINYKNKTLNARNIQLETMSGIIKSNLSFEQVNDDKLRMISTTTLDNINVRQLFYEFHNFGQETMRHKHLKGKIDSEIYLRNEWDSYFNPIDNHLYSFIDVTIKDGELLDFEPLMMMSDYISVQELKRIKFSTLENQIEIKNGLIEIPFMEIHSTAIDIAGAGTHTFDNVMDYDIKILLNEILSNKFKGKNKKQVSEFGIVEDDGIKGMNLFLKMKGTVDNPDISYNTLRLRESLDQGFKREKKELKEVIKNEFGNENNDKHIQDNPDYDNIIEWEE